MKLIGYDNPINEIQRQWSGENIIYHYTTLKIAFEHILPSGQIKFNKLENTDDPLEYKELLLSSSYWGERDLDVIDDEIQKAQERIRDLRKSVYQVACFSTNLWPRIDQSSIRPTMNQLGCTRSRMWSQYGDGHKGIVLVFDKDKFLVRLSECIENPERNVLHRYVDYSYQDFNRSNNINGNDIERDGIEAYCSKYIHKHADDLFFSKNLDYRDENEYRFVVKSDEYPFYLSFKDSLIGLVVGDRFPGGHFPNLLYYSDFYKIPCTKIHWENGIPLLIDFDVRDKDGKQVVFTSNNEE